MLSLVGSSEDKLEYVARAKSRYVIGWLISPDIGVHTEVKDMLSRVRYGLEPLEGNSDTVTTWLSNHWTGIYARYLIKNEEPGFTLDFSKSIEELQQELVKCISELEE